MSIRSRIIWVVLPLLVAALTLAGTASYFSAANGITRITREFFGFKLLELRKYAENQWALLTENGYAGNPEMVDAAKKALEIYSGGIILSESEVIFALDNSGVPVMSASLGDAPAIQAGEGAALLELLNERDEELVTSLAGGKERVMRSFYFTPFQWRIILSEEKNSFYRDVDRIKIQTAAVTAAFSLIAVVLLVLFSRVITNPLVKMVKAMRGIIETTDLSSRVDVAYSDETGRLAHTFNVMTGALESAYGQIKRYAFDAVLSQKKEQRIRQIFQKYVPQDVINESFRNPEQLLPGKNMDLAVLFSDIRSFTTLSEGMSPGDLVELLNRYFSPQVGVIYNRNGIVDKYIGDAIMALWGAPLGHGDDALQAVLSGVEMIEALKTFNEDQKRRGQKEINIGIGINYGEVTVGNIGAEQKRDYTVIGDPVNLASRLEGLTKMYRSPLLVSEFLYGEFMKGGTGAEGAELRFRLLDTVAVKGKTRGVKIYTVKNGLSDAEQKAWPVHERGMELYYRRSFREAAGAFRELLSLLPGDFNGENMLQRCEALELNPPPVDWDGVEIMHSK
ncbi:MAG: adenylate/guanylate cyclase domain-containing protein [Treponema sp.]|jgi:class 3 adenylate cyclase/HAMP domain-containing protein|nr:adenylate/guanylate cyclase domain-containing protein [Treponema sp.]